MKALHDFAKTLTDALAAMEGAKAAEERAKAAQQTAARALNNAENARIAADKTKAEAEAHVRTRMAELEKAETDSAAKIAAGERQYKVWIENAKGQGNAASETLTTLQKETAEATAPRATINPASSHRP